MPCDRFRWAKFVTQKIASDQMKSTVTARKYQSWSHLETSTASRVKMEAWKLNPNWFGKEFAVTRQSSTSVPMLKLKIMKQLQQMQPIRQTGRKSAFWTWERSSQIKFKIGFGAQHAGWHMQRGCFENEKIS